MKLWPERTFKDAVFNTVRNMNGDKASGPYGFSIAFSQHCWEVVNKDFMRVFHSFHDDGMFVRSLNATFIALMQKTDRRHGCKGL